MAESYGWAGKILRVNLTTGEITTQDDEKYHKLSLIHIYVYKRQVRTPTGSRWRRWVPTVRRRPSQRGSAPWQESLPGNCLLYTSRCV